MACGMPVLTYGREGPGETVENGVTGWLSKNEDELMEKAQKLEIDGYPPNMRRLCRRAALKFDIKRVSVSWKKHLKELENCGLIIRYWVNGNQYLWMNNFEKHQTGLRKDKESPSQIPPFSPELRRNKDGNDLTQVKDKVEAKDEEETKDKEKEETVSHSSLSIEEVITAYQDNILRGATVSEEMDNELRTVCTRYSPEWVLDAMKEALAQNKPTWRYMLGILWNWQRRGKRQG